MPDDASSLPDYVTLTPPEGAERAVIWLHGLGADGHDFEALFHPRMDQPALRRTRVILPHAPVQSVTINGGMAMRAWYDIPSAELTQDVDTTGLADSAEAIHGLLAQLQAEGIPPERTVLGGFSQGGVLALWAGLGYSRPLAGMAALSAYLPEATPMTGAQATTPLFLAHGRSDSLIPFHLGEQARDTLEEQGMAVRWRDYAMDHGVCDPEANDLLEWLGGLTR